MRGEAGGEGAADTALKTKTPHDNVGKNPTRQCGEKTPHDNVGNKDEPIVTLTIEHCHL